MKYASNKISEVISISAQSLWSVGCVIDTLVVRTAIEMLMLNPKQQTKPSQTEPNQSKIESNRREIHSHFGRLVFEGTSHNKEIKYAFK